MSYNGFDNVSCRSGITSRNSAPGGSEAAGSEMDASGQGPRQRRPVKYQTPQEVIDEFWTKFTTKTPGKGTSKSLPIPLRCNRVLLSRAFITC